MSAKFSVATNFESELIEGLKPYPVYEIYGKLSQDIIGGGRSHYSINAISKKRFKEHVQEAKKAGLGFNYLLNAACLDNIEITRKGQKEIRKLLDWLCEIEVTATTISNPLLLKIIKKKYSHLRVRVSVFTGVDHLRKAKYWEEQGADVICLDSLTVNREFQTLKTIRKNLTCELELLANNNCLQSCSLSPCHMNLLAHSSQSQHANKGFVIDHCILECSKMKLQDPVNYLRSDWIRPEDLHFYEDLGYQQFKLVERGLPTEFMLKRVKAYAEKSYNGNLLDLIQPYGHQTKKTPSAWKAFWEKRKFIFLLNPFQLKIWKLRPFMELGKTKGMLVSSEKTSQAPDVYIDNKLLDGFIERFPKTGCRNISCDDCQHCHRFAQKAVVINEQFKDKCLSLHKKIDHLLDSGELFI